MIILTHQFSGRFNWRKTSRLVHYSSTSPARFMQPDVVSLLYTRQSFSVDKKRNAKPQNLMGGQKFGHRKGYPWHEIVIYVAEKMERL